MKEVNIKQEQIQFHERVSFFLYFGTIALVLGLMVLIPGSENDIIGIGVNIAMIDMILIAISMAFNIKINRTWELIIQYAVVTLIICIVSLFITEIPRIGWFLINLIIN
jgi:hypothetical protein